MYSPTLFISIFQNSIAEQLPITIYLSSHLITGIVTNVDAYTVELRISDGKRCAIALDKIEAVTIA